MENLRNRKLKTKITKEETVCNNNVQEVKKEIVNEAVGSTIPRSDYEDQIIIKEAQREIKPLLRFHCELDLVSILLLLCGVFSRMYKLEQPRNVVFDELHYGRYVSLYMKNIFFFDAHPPLGKQLVAAVAYLVGFDGSFKFDKIGTEYSETFPLMTLRLVPAFFGSLIVPVAYHLLLELNLTQWTSILGAILLLLDNALLTQSRFILMESMLLFFALFGILCLLKFRKHYNNPYSFLWFTWLTLASLSLTCAMCVKYVGFYSCCLAGLIVLKDLWSLLCSKLSDRNICARFIVQVMVVSVTSLVIYVGVFYVHLSVLYKAGPHDSVMTSAFQASLEGGLASITKGQPLFVAHGSQITLRHSHGRTCWLHSHNQVYPIRYPDKRGSSHQQQVTCYSFKDVNNWWIVKRPDKNDLVVEQPVDAIKHGDVVQLVHGITSRALNSHDVAAAVSPQCQEVSCYIDYNVSMPAQILWKVDIINKEQTGKNWQTIQSMVRLIHVGTNTALKFSGRQLPDWGYNQHEVVADRILNQDDTVWNVEEHRYTKSDNQKDRERDMVTAEMIPTKSTSLTFWEKFFELHYKMWFSSTETVQNHMYSSEPLEWPLMNRGIAYWVSSKSNAQIHLLGNLLVWYSATLGVLLYISLLIFYLLRRRRNCLDLDQPTWDQFLLLGEVLLAGYLLHYLPYFFLDRTLFLHHYLPAFAFKVMLLVGVLEHLYFVFKDVLKQRVFARLFVVGLIVWVGMVGYVFRKFTVLSYGTSDLSTNDILDLRWKDSWDFIVHKS